MQLFQTVTMQFLHDIKSVVPGTTHVLRILLLPLVPYKLGKLRSRSGPFLFGEMIQCTI